MVVVVVVVVAVLSGTVVVDEPSGTVVVVGALVGGFDANGDPAPGVKDGTPAAAAGIKDGDIIVSIDGKIIDEEHPLDATLAQFSPGDTVTVDVLRDGVHVSLEVTLGTRPAGL